VRFLIGEQPIDDAMLDGSRELSSVAALSGVTRKRKLNQRGT
jgi:hypothetical protein